MQDQNRICKVCHHGDSFDNPLCYPCKCNGTIKFIHEECLFQFIESSNKNYCTICKHKYSFKDVYKPDTPKRVPLGLIVQGVYKKVREWTIKVGSNILGLILVLTINGALVYPSLGIPLSLNLSSIFIFIVCGSVSTGLSYANYHLYTNLGNYLVQLEYRRTLRIDPLGALNSIATDHLTSRSHMDSDYNVQTIVSQLSLNLNRGESSPTVGGTVEDGLSTIQEEIETVSSSDESLLMPATTNNSLLSSPFKLSSFLKSINFSLLWWTVHFLTNLVKFDLRNDFLEAIYLKVVSKYLLVLYLLLLSLVGITKILSKVFRPFKLAHSFARIYHMGYLGILHLVYFQGVGVHYIFSDVVNHGQTVLKLEGSYLSAYKPFLSLIFHFILGFAVTSTIKKTLSFFEKKLRPGLLYFLAEPSSNDLFFVYNISQQEVFEFIIRDFLYGTFTLLSIRYAFTMLCGSLSNGYHTFSIWGVNKFLLILKVIDMVSGSFHFFHSIVSYVVNGVIWILSSLMGLSNYLYGSVAIVDKADLGLFRWLPNKHKFMHPQLVKRKYRKKVTRDDVERYFNKSSERSFSVFYTPHLYRYRCMFIGYVCLSVYLFFYIGLFRLTNHLESLIGLHRWFDHSGDVLLISLSGLILLVLRLIWYLSRCLVQMKPIMDDIVAYCKSAIVLIFSVIVWPLWSSFIVLILYSESLRSIRPTRLISIFFSSSSIISFIFDRIIFTRNIREYSFATILKKLYGFISVMTFIVICTSLLRSYSYLVVIETSEIPFLLIFGISASLFYLKHCIKNAFMRFIDKIKTEHFLVKRHVENYTTVES